MSSIMQRHYLLLALALLVGCASPPRVAPTPPGANPRALGPAQMYWPPQYDPADAGFFVHNEIDVRAPPEVVWDILVDAERWAAFYEGAADVHVEGRTDGRLAPGVSFRWRTMDLDFVSTVVEHAPPYRLSWESRKASIQGYHSWLVVPTSDGCRVVTAESQHGFLTAMQALFVPNKLRRLHDVWLRGIKQRAEARGGAR